jgi:hypothetical protein
MNKNSFLIELSASERADFGRVDFAAQSEPQKVFSAIWALESQVNNGGFLQYFASSDGETASYAPAALRKIGAKACAEIVERALRAVSSAPLPEPHEEREQLVESLDSAAREAVEALDQDFFTYPDNLTNLLFAHVAAHAEAFGPVPTDLED